jgi:hypothetical protein
LTLVPNRENSLHLLLTPRPGLWMDFYVFKRTEIIFSNVFEVIPSYTIRNYFNCYIMLNLTIICTLLTLITLQYQQHPLPPISPTPNNPHRNFLSEYLNIIGNGQKIRILKNQRILIKQRHNNLAKQPLKHLPSHPNTPTPIQPPLHHKFRPSDLFIKQQPHYKYMGNFV